MMPTLLYAEAAKRYALWTALLHRFVNASHHPVWLGRVEMAMKPLREHGVPRDHYSIEVIIKFDDKQMYCEMPVIEYTYELDTADASIEILSDIVESLESLINQHQEGY